MIQIEKSRNRQCKEDTQWHKNETTHYSNVLSERRQEKDYATFSNTDKKKGKNYASPAHTPIFLVKKIRCWPA